VTGRPRVGAGLASEPAMSGITRTTVFDLAYIYPYDGAMGIEWDPAKAAANLRAHGVAFSDWATVLADDQALTREDPGSRGEQRFVTLGLSATGRLLVVVYTRRRAETYRIISAWKANRPQRQTYEQNRS
jgi:uncharacterized protein